MNEKAALLIGNIEKVIVGKRDICEKIVIALISGGHVLIEDVPGVGKTMLVSALSKSVNGKFNRIQFTPDLMPSDIMGFTMIDRRTGESEYKQGAAMCNFLLADEINRASPKAQSSLLEIMEELQISVDGVTHPLPVPFMTLATQNPVETYGTYHLPEAQMDRFMMKLSLGYPSAEEEMLILDRTDGCVPTDKIGAVLTLDDINELRTQVNTVEAAENVRQYIISIVAATRKSPYVTLGASPRGSIALLRAARASALVDGRTFITPDDVRKMAESVLAHRLIVSPKGKTALGTAERIITEIVKTINVPI